MKVLAHAHTTFSMDGHLSPERLAAEAARRGFGAVLLADHHESLDPERFAALMAECAAIRHPIMIPGVERSFNGYHVCAFGPESWPEGTDLPSWAAAVRRAGGLLSCAHPVRYDNRIPDDVLHEVDLVEVWNASRRYNGSLAPDPRAWDLLAGERLGIASQDVHRTRDLSSVAIEIPSAATSREVITAIRSGTFELSGRLTRVHNRPTGMRANVWLANQRLRPIAWAVPVAAYRLARWGLRAVRGGR
jgi:PHP domain